MKKTLICTTLWMLFLSSVSSATIAVHSVEASGTIYIRADGSIDPPIAGLSSGDNITYSLTGNLTWSIVIEKDNIVLDGAMHVLQGSGSGNGITLSGRRNVTIRDVDVRGFYQGILIYNASRDNTVFGVRAIDNWYGGICVDSSANTTLTGNAVVHGKQGITLSGNTERNAVTRNIIDGSEDYGVNLIATSKSVVERNTVSHCGWHGIRLWMASCNNVVLENTVTDCSVGIEVSYASNNNTVSHNCFTRNRVVGVGIGYRIPESGPEWGGAAENRITENNVTDNKLGIQVIYSKNNTLYRNNIEGNNRSVAIIGSNANLWDDEVEGNYWSDYNGTDADDTIGDAPYVIDGNNRDRYPLMTPIEVIPCWDLTGLVTSIVAPQNETYACNQVPFTFIVNVVPSWVGYSLDGQANVTVRGNTTLTGLLDGPHSLILYVGYIDDAYQRNMDTSSPVYFTIDTTPPSIAIVAPTSTTYNTPDIPLTFTLSEAYSWLGYSLDGQANVTITGNGTLTQLAAGTHSLRIYATDTVGHTGRSDVTQFYVVEPLPVLWIGAGLAVPVVGITIAVILKKRSSRH
jgi:parallel beta-helix repeat protein